MELFDPNNPEHAKASALEAKDLARAVAAVERYRSGQGGQVRSWGILCAYMGCRARAVRPNRVGLLLPAMAGLLRLSADDEARLLQATSTAEKLNRKMTPAPLPASGFRSAR